MAGQSQDKLFGRVVRITFQNPENGYTVAKVQARGQAGLVSVVGKLPGVVEGQEIEISGRKVLHPKFGPQMEAESFLVRQPSDTEGVRRYLASGLIKGVGPKLAERIVTALGPQALELILEQPERLSQVPGIGAKRAQAITQAVKDHGQLREVMVFLQGHGVPASTALRIFRRYGAGTLGVLKNDPHRLAADIQGMGFATADQIAARLGIARDHPSRLMAGLMYTLGQALEEGHVFLPYDELFDQAAKILRVERGLLGPAFARLHLEQKIVLEEFDGQKAVYLAAMAVLEGRAAAGIARLCRRPGLLPEKRAAKAAAWVSRNLAVKPSPGQAEALKKLLTAGVSVLTGGPGTGKTTLVRALITIAQRMDKVVALAAPTGRAAKRLCEATGQEAFTLHRLLEYSPKENRFGRNAARPLEADLLVVDESSMIDIWLMAYLVEALGPDTRLVLVGDANQLPSVGPGLVLRQLIDSRSIQVAELKEIFRQDQAGLIVQNAHRILAGRMPRLPEKGEEVDFYFLSEPDPARAAEQVRQLVCERLPQRFNLDPLRDIQVLAPMHRGLLGCQHLNDLLRNTLNPPDLLLNPPEREGGLRPGDKVMQVRNNYDLEVFNGDMGRIEDLDDDGCLATLGERKVRYTLPDMDDLSLAYAVTVHKAQGSEYPAVVIALGMGHYVMLNRALLYTAVTRGQRLVILVGHGGALRRAVEHAEPLRRLARLHIKIDQEIKRLK